MSIIRSVSSPLHPIRHHAFPHRFTIISQPYQGTKVDKQSCCGQHVVAKLCSFVVPGENVVVIVPPFAQSDEGYKHVFGRIYISEKYSKDDFSIFRLYNQFYDILKVEIYLTNLS